MSQANEWKYIDPDRDNPARKGMLLSDQISEFQKRNLLIAKNFEPANLRPAAYTLRIGSPYIDSKGARGELCKQKKPYFKMEPNSIVYVSTYEKLDLPYYIAARFNLRVKWVYKGILLGTGPQVEPGYVGYLSCPLYNLTDRPIRIDYKEDFATIDFERTTEFCPGASAVEIAEGIKTEHELDTIKWDDKEYLVFKQREYPPLKLHPEYDVRSSLLALSQEVRTWRHIGIGLAVSFFALTLALLSFGANAYTQVKSLEDKVSQLTAQVQDAARSSQDLRRQLVQLSDEIANANASAKPTTQPTESRRPASKQKP